MAWRWINRAASLLLALVVLATLGGGYLFYRAMPAASGVEKLPGLKAEVRIWREHFGVPHIFAASMDDAARALGYVHASERMFQMEIMRRVGQGRMAEIRGADLLGVDKFRRAQAAGPWVDALRKFVPDDQKLYTWWSYRSPDWSKVNKGRRLDHIWVSPALADAVESMRVLRETRSWRRPSDHAPVMAKLAL